MAHGADGFHAGGGGGGQEVFQGARDASARGLFEECVYHGIFAAREVGDESRGLCLPAEAKGEHPAAEEVIARWRQADAAAFDGVDGLRQLPARGAGEGLAKEFVAVGLECGERRPGGQPEADEAVRRGEARQMAREDGGELGALGGGWAGHLGVVAGGGQRAGEAQFFDVLQGLRGAGVYGVERAVAEGEMCIRDRPTPTPLRWI